MVTRSVLYLLFEPFFWPWKFDVSRRTKGNKADVPLRGGRRLPYIFDTTRLLMGDVEEVEETKEDYY